MNASAKKLLALVVSTATLIYIGTRDVLAYVPLETLPNPGNADTSTPSGYLSMIYTLGIGVAGVLAVLMIVVGGIQYIGSGMSPSAKEDAKGKITNAILGLLLALGSWLLLHTINPDLVSLRF